MPETRTLTYLEIEPPTTRPDLELPDGVSHICNMAGGELVYYASRNELAWRVFTRKDYMRRFFDTSVLLLGEPQPTVEYSTSELIARGVVGVYGQRRVVRP